MKDLVIKILIAILAIVLIPLILYIILTYFSDNTIAFLIKSG